MGDLVCIRVYLAEEILLGSLLESGSSKAAGMGKTSWPVPLQPIRNQISGERLGKGGLLPFGAPWVFPSHVQAGERFHKALDAETRTSVLAGLRSMYESIFYFSKEPRHLSFVSALAEPWFLSRCRFLRLFSFDFSAVENRISFESMF